MGTKTVSDAAANAVAARDLCHNWGRFRVAENGSTRLENSLKTKTNHVRTAAAAECA